MQSTRLRVGIGRLYDKEKEMDAYQLFHPEFDALTQPIGDFIPEIQSLLNYSPSAEIQTEFLERIRCALYQNNPNRFAVNLERMDMLASPATVLQDMVTWDLKQPYAVATTQYVEAFELRDRSYPSSSGYQPPRRPSNGQSAASAAGPAPASTYVPAFPPWIDHKYWPNSLLRDNIEHTPRYKSAFMNFLFDKNYAHQYSSELFSPKGRDFSVGVRHAWICGPSLVSPSLICPRMVVPSVKHPFLFLDLILLRPTSHHEDVDISRLPPR